MRRSFSTESTHRKVRASRGERGSILFVVRSSLSLLFACFEFCLTFLVVLSDVLRCDENFLRVIVRDALQRRLSVQTHRLIQQRGHCRAEHHCRVAAAGAVRCGVDSTGHSFHNILRRNIIGREGNESAATRCAGGRRDSIVGLVDDGEMMRLRLLLPRRGRRILLLSRVAHDWQEERRRGEERRELREVRQQAKQR